MIVKKKTRQFSDPLSSTSAKIFRVSCKCLHQLALTPCACLLLDSGPVDYFIFQNHDFQYTTPGESQIKTLLVGAGPGSPWGAF